MSDIQEPQSVNEAHDVAEQQSTPVEPRSPADDIAPPLVGMIASIHAAVSRGATAEARAVGATACRTILTVLEARPGQPLAASQPAMLPASPTSPLASLLSQPGLLSKLAAMSRDELINLLKQITGTMPVRAPTPTAGAPRFHLIEIPQARKPGGDR
jgi:hypothetical protein